MAPEEQRYLERFVAKTDFYNRLVLGSLLPSNLWDPLPHFIQGWLRNYLAVVLIYLVSGLLWCFFIYHIKRGVFVPQDKIPSNRSMLLQIYVSLKSMPWFALLPSVSEFMIEAGWTKCYHTITEAGWTKYIIHTLAYLILVEFGIYWAHRLLHDVKPLYKFLHSEHHIYNKQNTISPFAGFALHPLDGIIQASPHVMVLFIVPMHFTTHLAVMFADGIWTTNIHDSIDVGLWPIMGAGYHMVHHFTYRNNYGHYTVWMDWMFGTLCTPTDQKKPKKTK